MFAITRYARQALSTTLLTGAVVITSGTALLIVGMTLFQDTKVEDAVTCWLGINEECLLQDLRERDAELERKRLELLELQKRSAELEALYERLAQLEHAGSSYVIFHSKKIAKYEVTTGHAYASLINPDRLTKGWCYTNGDGKGGVTTQLDLATFDKSMRLKIQNPSDRMLQSFGVSRSEFSRLVMGCQWPEGVA